MSVIVLEFNELTPALMDRFIDEGRLPNFKRFRDESIVAVTDAEEAPPNLEPWIQWITVHTGLSYDQHKVFDLGDGPNLTAPRIWDLVSDAGEKVWVCGSMNGSFRGADINGFLLPDPWATRIRPYPQALFAPFFDVVSAYVQDHNLERPPVTLRQHAGFVAFMLSHGLSLRTMFEAAAQLVGERLGRRGHWRRAAVLDRLQWDVFRHFQRRFRPRFSTFFLNSTAHFQHYYWRSFEPGRFEVQPTQAELGEFSDAILMGYRKMDSIVGEMMAEMAPQDTLVLCSALGQQPLLKYEHEGGRQLYKVRDPKALLAFAGVEATFRFAPVMADQFRVDFEDEATAAFAAERLAALSLPDGKPFIWSRREGSEVYAGIPAILARTEGVLVGSKLHNHKALFDDLVYPIGGTSKSGMHHPDGILWVRRPDRRHVKVERRVSLREVAPTLLALTEVDADAAFAFPPMAEVVATPAAQPGSPVRRPAMAG